jgi:catechol 2,3-dioxygenase-like lactoylglutathione lyase family enzyme
MKTPLRSSHPLTTVPWLAFLAVLGLAWFATASRGAENAGEFTKPVIDVGMVVKDQARTASFLTNAIGFKEVPGFSVTPELGKKIGLTAGHAGTVRMFVLDGPEPATRIKVLSFPDAGAKASDQTYIHSVFGMRYFTIFVNDLTRAVERLNRAGVRLEGETPVDLGGGTFIVVVRDPDGNFFELIGRKP